MLRAADINLSSNTAGVVNTNILLQVWESSITKILNGLAPIKSFPLRKREVPYIHSEVLSLMKTRNKMEVQCKANPNNTYLWTQLKNMRKKVKSHLRRLSKLHGQKLLKASNNTKKAWKFIRETTFTVKNKSKPSIDPVILNEFFSSLVQDSPQDSSLPHKQDLFFFIRLYSIS